MVPNLCFSIERLVPYNQEGKRANHKSGHQAAKGTDKTMENKIKLESLTTLAKENRIRIEIRAWDDDSKLWDTVDLVDGDPESIATQAHEILMGEYDTSWFPDYFGYSSSDDCERYRAADWRIVLKIDDDIAEIARVDEFPWECEDIEL